MRTGAIFARGSCRALKWMALLGVVFALGVVEAAAQAPTLDTAEWTPEDPTVNIDASESVWTQGAPASAFTVTWTGPDGSPATGERHTIPTAVADAEDDFTVTFDKVIPTGAQSVTVTYTAPDPADPTRDILDTDTGGYTAVAAGNVTTVNEKNVRPMIAAIDNMTFPKGTAIEAFQLPAATGNAAFTYIVSDLPDGLTFDADGADDDAAATDDNRMVSGTPMMVTDDAQIVTYTATDGSTPPDSASARFTITVTDKPATPSAPTVTPTMNTSRSLDVSWMEPEDNNSPIFDYEVQYRMVGADRWQEHTADLGTKTSEKFTGLTNGEEYEFQVRARNDVGWSEYSMSGEGTPMASEALPAAPAAPTVTATANTRGSLNVSWTAPADNGSTITGYKLRYKMSSASDWANKSDVVTGRSTTLTGLSDATMYDVQVLATNANGDGPWSVSGQGTTIDGPAAPDTTLADIIKIDPSGAEERQIGGVKRLHLNEGDTSTVTVTAEWTVAQLREIYAADATPAPALVYLFAVGETDGASWLSGAEVNNQDGQDVPDNWEAVQIDIPKKPKDSARDRETVSAEGTTRLALLQDDDAEDEGFRLRVGATSRGVSLEASRSMIETDMLLVIDDSDPQKIVLKQTSKGTIYEGGADVEFEVAADPELVDLTIDVGFDLTDADGVAVPSRVLGVTPARGTITADGEIEVAVDLDDNDGNREDEEITLHAEIASRNRDDIDDVSESFTVFDVHQLPELSVSPKTGTVAEGEEIELTLTLDRNPRNTRAVDPETPLYTSEPIDVTVMSDDSSVEITPRPVKFPKHDGKSPWTQEMTVTVMPKANNDIDGDRDVVLNAEVAGTVAANGMGKGSYDAVSTLMVTDGTAKLVSPKSDEDIQAVIYPAKEAGMGADGMLNPGEMIVVAPASALFNSADGVTLSYTAMSDNEDVATVSVSGSTVTVTAEDMAGVMAHITITAHASMPSGAKGLPQTDPREASVIFPVEVGLEALAIMLTGPEDPNVVEGGMGAMVTATANRAVTEDVTVTLMRDRAMSTASDDDYMADPITITAGEMSGSTMVMAVEDDMMETVDNMPEELVLYGMAEGMAGEVTGEVHLHLWDAAVPALPVIAQLLLAAFLAIGGYRRYLRR